MSYSAAHHGWSRYCAAAGVDIDIHQLRHSHATELITAGVSIEVVRKRLGHASTETTQVYALLADQVADNEIRLRDGAGGCSRFGENLAQRTSSEFRPGGIP
ncbi:tyrosine-type recombinase/integrase [Nocardia farcinica]|uniref:tyrosine-type recombinase/integrase n=1 Tax=Nocardia farcinica TaxID=37329 RepID=UPI002B4B1299|nr:tyrosine-type recombinase/integrase [Nocardia farcinica]